MILAALGFLAVSPFVALYVVAAIVRSWFDREGD